MPGINDFIGLLVLSWIFIVLFNMTLGGILGFFYDYLLRQGRLKIELSKIT
jgi:hypothetical protein